LLSVLKPPQRDLMIRRAFKFFHKDPMKFLPGDFQSTEPKEAEVLKARKRADKRREKLFSYASEMVEVTNLIFKMVVEKQQQGPLLVRGTTSEIFAAHK